MNKKEFEEILASNKKIIDDNFKYVFDKSFYLYEPLLYACSGGKRIRSCLYLETLKMLGKEIDKNDIYFAISLEMIHAYSLVHDDLPAMDNDDFRRGLPSLHKKFGEDIGILTGDALITEASRILFDICKEDVSYIYPSSFLMEMAGYKGMIYGQVLDIKASKDVDLDYLLLVYEKKTSDLFLAAIIGAALTYDNHFESNNLQAFNNLKSYAINLGLAFQIQDDLLEESFEDELNILNIMSKDDAIKILDDVDTRAKEAISNFDDNDFLTYLVYYLRNRDK